MNNENQINEIMLQQWKQDRLGKFTSSAIGKIMGKPRDKARVFNDAGETYIYAKIGETLTFEANEVSSAAIKWGEEHEEAALATFAQMAGFKVVNYGKTNPVFFPYADAPEHAGGSPDGMIEELPAVPGKKCVVEIKCPYESKYHAEVLHKVRTGSFDLAAYDPDYYAQVQANIFFTGAQGAFFVSYDPRCVEYRYCCVWAFVERNDEFIASMKERLDMAIEIKKKTLGDLGFYSSTSNVAA